MVGSRRIAMREGSGTGTSGLIWLLSDHLGSTTVSVTAAGQVSEQRYTPWGEERYTSGGALPTSFRYTGQREEADLGLYYYGARWYDPALGHFVQADSVVPDPSNPPDWDRYAYSSNNPINFIDPTGHASRPPTTDECGPDGIYCENRRFSQSSIAKIFKKDKDRKAAARTVATFLDDPDHFMGLYMDPGNAWGSSDDVAYLDAYAEYNLGMSAEELLFATYGYLDPFEMRAARTQYLLGNAQTGDVILATAAVGGVYSLINPMGNVVRIGRTKDFTARASQYRNDPNYFDLQFRREYYTDDYATQRGLEQMLYEHYGQPPLNIYRPIRIGNPRMANYLTSARSYLYNLFGVK